MTHGLIFLKTEKTKVHETQTEHYLRKKRSKSENALNIQNQSFIMIIMIIKKLIYKININNLLLINYEEN